MRSIELSWQQTNTCLSWTKKKTNCDRENKKIWNCIRLSILYIREVQSMVKGLRRCDQQWMVVPECLLGYWPELMSSMCRWLQKQTEFHCSIASFFKKGKTRLMGLYFGCTESFIWIGQLRGSRFWTIHKACLPEAQHRLCLWKLRQTIAFVFSIFVWG